MSLRHWVMPGAWYLAYILALEFLRFRFGLFPISGAFMFLGCLVFFFDRLFEKWYIDKMRQRAGAIQDANANH